MDVEVVCGWGGCVWMGRLCGDGEVVWGMCGDGEVVYGWGGCLWMGRLCGDGKVVWGWRGCVGMERLVLLPLALCQAVISGLHVSSIFNNPSI